MKSSPTHNFGPYGTKSAGDHLDGTSGTARTKKGGADKANEALIRASYANQASQGPSQGDGGIQTGGVG